MKKFWPDPPLIAVRFDLDLVLVHTWHSPFKRSHVPEKHLKQINIKALLTSHGRYAKENVLDNHCKHNQHNQVLLTSSGYCGVCNQHNQYQSVAKPWLLW